MKCFYHKNVDCDYGSMGFDMGQGCNGCDFNEDENSEIWERDVLIRNLRANIEFYKNSEEEKDDIITGQQAELLAKEYELERNGYVIDALVDKIRVLEEKIFDLENKKKLE